MLYYKMINTYKKKMIQKNSEQIKRLETVIQTITYGNKSQFAKLVKKKPSQISRMLNIKLREKIYSENFLSKLKQLNINPEWLIYGTGSMMLDKDEPETNSKNNSSVATNFKHHKFSDEGYYNFLVDLESEGRIAFFSSKFPSSAYLKENTKYSQNVRRNVIQKEYYSIESVLLFAFSRFGYQYPKETKLIALTEMINTFKDNYKKELIFLDTIEYFINFQSRFNGGNLEFVFKNKQILIETPIGYIQISDDKLWYELQNILQNELGIPQIRQNDSIEILEVLKKTIESNKNEDFFIQMLDKKNRESAKLFAKNIIDLLKNYVFQIY